MTCSAAFFGWLYSRTTSSRVALDVARDGVLGNRHGLFDGGVRGQARELEHRRDIAVREIADGLLAAGGDVHLHAFSRLVLDEVLGQAKNVAVEATGQTAV